MSDEPSNIVITLRSLPLADREAPEVKRLAQLLKIALRRYGFKCLGVTTTKEKHTDG